MDIENEEGKKFTSKDTFCYKCGTEIKEGQKYCGNCGNKLGSIPKKIKLNKKLLITIFIVLGIFTAIIVRHIIIFNKVVNDYKSQYQSMGYNVESSLLKNTIYIDTVVDLEYNDSYSSNSIVKSLWGEHETLAKDISSMSQSTIENHYNIKINVSNRLYDSNNKLLLEGRNGEIIYNVESNVELSDTNNTVKESLVDKNGVVDIEKANVILDKCSNEVYEEVLLKVDDNESKTTFQVDDVYYMEELKDGEYESPTLTIYMDTDYTFDEWMERTSDKENGLNEMKKFYNKAKEVCEKIRALDKDYKIIEIIIEGYSDRGGDNPEHYNPEELFFVRSFGLNEDGTIDENKKPWLTFWSDAKPNMQTTEYRMWVGDLDYVINNP